MNFGLTLSVFLSIFVAELPDKTSLAALVLATRYKPLVVFSGAALAFVVQCVVAVAVGGIFALLPQNLVQIVAGLLFLLFAALIWFRNEQESAAQIEAETVQIEKSARLLKLPKGFSASFMVIFLAEWGDLTQISTATLTANFKDPLSVFVGSLLALWTVAAIAIFIGNRARTLINPFVIQKISAVIFALVGLFLLLSLLLD